MSKRLYMDFVDQDGNACFVDAYAIDAIVPQHFEGRVAAYSTLLVGVSELTVEGETTAILQRLVKASQDEFHLSQFGFIPREPATPYAPKGASAP